MNRECIRFRDFILKKDFSEELSNQALQHLQTCTNCQTFYRQYRQTLKELKHTDSPVVPERIQRKMEKRIWNSAGHFRPAYVLAIVFILLVVVLVFRQNRVSPLANKKDKIEFDYALYDGKPANVYLEQSQYYVHIFISNKGD